MGVRSATLGAVKWAAAGWDMLRPPGSGVVVLLYHRVGAGSGLELDMPAELFGEQMSTLAATGRVASLDEGLAALDQPAGAADPVVVTFDDGTSDVVDNALPILVDLGVPMTIYVATDFVEQQRDFPDAGVPLSWGALAEAVSTGLVTVGSHTDRHAILDRLEPDAIDAELTRSIELIEDRLGVSADHFAYPKGEARSAAADSAVRRHFRSGALAKIGVNAYGATDVHRLARTPVQTSDGMRWFERKLDGGMSLEGTLREQLNRRRYESTEN